MARTFRITILLLLIVTMWSTVRIQERVSRLDGLTQELDLSVLDSCGVITDGCGFGSWVAIGPDLILTAGHCVGQGYTWVEIGMETFEIIGEWASDTGDIGLIRVDANLPYLELGQMPEVLDEVYLVGSPYTANMKNSITKGVVSHLDRNYWKWENLIQTDAEGAPGSSGGPLLNTSGQIIGICVTGLTPGGGATLCETVVSIRAALEEYNAT